MSTQKAKFELFTRLQNMGFTYEEAVSLRRIEMTLQRWAELECGNERGAVERDEKTGKPRFYYDVRGVNGWMRKSYAVADREKGALRRLKAIVDARNARNEGTPEMAAMAQDHVFAYSQGDCRGCMFEPLHSCGSH